MAEAGRDDRDALPGDAAPHPTSPGTPAGRALSRRVPSSGAASDTFADAAPDGDAPAADAVAPNASASDDTPAWPERALAVRRAAARLCAQHAWAALHELPLPNHRRADLLALRPDGGFVCIEVKSGARDFLTDNKWPEYREFCDELYFAVDTDFPPGLLPQEAGLIVAHGGEATLVRSAPVHRLPHARRRALLHRFATVAARRLACLEDPAATAALRAALRVE